MYNIGIDIGSVATKIVIMKNKEIFDCKVSPSGWNPKETCQMLIDEIIDKNNLNKNKIKTIVATGYGRVALDFVDKKVTEITCHGKGAKFLNSNTKSIIDIGGQDSKVIILDEEGRVLDFIMNDKCAAGTGRFLEVICTAMGIDVKELSDIAYNGEPIKINSMCTVFAESEIISLKSRGTNKEDIAAGLVHSVVDKVVSLASKMRLEEEIFFSGGLCSNEYLKSVLEKKLNKKIITSKYAQFAGAIGAALLG
ncbi:acyl-CoA dehydratase activase [Tepidibacter thalassicus]|uniref:CoA-substrate-specific enzyme activase, putative n=1 Tax=Tepidibacter thalassicus DSM 15285 TaxID=1123350 RepID=A0A1M5QH40_9FIRM|nr:acyl-CoA dehydratase activase [Tepidibacter thalassicus]SHH12843.1 CoA-substrate-specific enzyme activase, putative [Tepidibacter thalassicus DSM 15285]